MLTFAVAMTVALSSPVLTVDQLCDTASNLIGPCVSASNGGDHVDLSGTVRQPAEVPDTGDPVSTAPPPSPSPSTCLIESVCNRADYGVIVYSDITAEDLASFHPAAPTLGGEPAGYGIAGLPTNLIAAASPQTIPGTLFDEDVLVRFEPAGYIVDYGDGTSTRTTTGGATWDALGLTQFSPTATSHVYAEPGTYTVTATVQYTASVFYVSFDWDTWWPVTGYITLTGAPYEVRVLEARTALVDHTCTETPAAPGC